LGRKFWAAGDSENKPEESTGSSSELAAILFLIKDNRNRIPGCFPDLRALPSAKNSNVYQIITKVIFTKYLLDSWA
jgi:hypothetical protein